MPALPAVMNAIFSPAFQPYNLYCTLAIKGKQAVVAVGFTPSMTKQSTVDITTAASFISAPVILTRAGDCADVPEIATDKVEADDGTLILNSGMANPS